MACRRTRRRRSSTPRCSAATCRRRICRRCWAAQDAALIARHLELAGDDGQAADRYLRAANHAVELGGNADAFRQLTRALKLLPADDHERRFTAHRLREEILRR